MKQATKAILAIVALAVVVLGGDAFYVVKEYQQAVVLRFGKFVRTVRSPGLHLKVPIILQVTKYDKRLLGYDIAPTEIVTKDKRTLLVDSFSKWRITDPELFYKRVRTEANARGRIKDIIYSELWQEFGQHALEDIVSVSRRIFMKKVTTRSNEKARELKMGIEILDVRLKRADLPPENQNAVFRRMREERKRIASQFRAEGREAANKIRAKADKSKTIMLAEAYRKEQEIRGEGDAKSIKIYADAYNQDAEFYEFIRALESYGNALKTNSSVILTNESEFLKYFEKTKHVK